MEPNKGKENELGTESVGKLAFPVVYARHRGTGDQCDVQHG